ncbi:hypothetical protein CERSUDRAFT_94633 [Gelatoporia subvermispora B]|uniref:GmrSD restriction endonucleases N-terminal domain-containing protein n=1 Tax=Ceriporiopsis subvermispora (strain B) TaxID=914234 RepID=M2RGN5_CERS8|nr:hypothetical protein CERSUDRAFT_94633 [Gelatoporia subvermispora B]
MSQSDDKDVDELQSDIEENDNGFHISERLDPPHACLYSTQQLHTLIHEGVIDLNPPYQRDVVWTEPKQIKLLDSIFRNFYVPPVVFVVLRDEDGEEVRKCVDGKQRLTSIQKFFDGQIPYKDPKTKKSYWYTLPDNQKGARLEVPEYWKRDFASKQITCVEYRNLSASNERDIFQRVQLGMPLTAAEKLQAIASPWAEWVSELDTRYVNSDGGLTEIIDVDMKRGRDFQCLAQLVYCCDSYPEQVMPTPQKLETWLLRTDPPSEVFQKAIQEVLTEFWHIAHTPHLNDAFTQIAKRVAPIEFVFVGVLLYVMRAESHRDRADELYNMRRHVRTKFADVRARQDVVKVLWNFIEGTVSKYEQDVQISSKMRTLSHHDTGSQKRRRKKDDDEISDEYRPHGYSRTPKRGKVKSSR